MKLRLARKITHKTPPEDRRGSTHARVTRAMNRWIRRWSRTWAKRLRAAMDSRAIPQGGTNG